MKVGPYQWLSVIAEEKVTAPFRKRCWWLPNLFCDSPWDRLNFAWKEFGHSSLFGLSDCYCCWLMAPSQPCLLSAGLSSKTKDVVVWFLFFFWSVEPSLFVRLCVLVSFYQPKMLLCAAGILPSLAPVDTQLHRRPTKRLRRRDFVASPFTLAHIPLLLLCAWDWKRNIVWQWRLSLSCWSRPNAATHSVPGIWMAGTWTSCILGPWNHPLKSHFLLVCFLFCFPESVCRVLLYDK